MSPDSSVSAHAAYSYLFRRRSCTCCLSSSLSSLSLSIVSAFHLLFLSTFASAFPQFLFLIAIYLLSSLFASFLASVSCSLYTSFHRFLFLSLPLPLYLLLFSLFLIVSLFPPSTAAAFSSLLCGRRAPRGTLPRSGDAFSALTIRASLPPRRNVPSRSIQPLVVPPRAGTSCAGRGERASLMARLRRRLRTQGGAPTQQRCTSPFRPPPWPTRSTTGRRRRNSCSLPAHR